MNAKKMLKTAAYLKAPQKTFAALNPGKTALLKAGGWAARRALPERFLPQRKRRSPGKTLLKGLGAAAVALPIGLWLGRRVLEQEPAAEQPVR